MRRRRTGGAHGDAALVARGVRGVRGVRGERGERGAGAVRGAVRARRRGGAAPLPLAPSPLPPAPLPLAPSPLPPATLPLAPSPLPPAPRPLPLPPSPSRGRFRPPAGHHGPLATSSSTHPCWVVKP
jgi:hypothetical protein